MHEVEDAAQAWRRWGLSYNREHIRARKYGMPVTHDTDGCGRVIERLYLRPDPRVRMVGAGNRSEVDRPASPSRGGDVAVSPGGVRVGVAADPQRGACRRDGGRC